MLEKLFKLSEKKTDVKSELIAGLTTFLAMAYILGVNPSILSEAGMDFHSVFMATALSSALASIIMGLVSNYPVALAPGMGVNALFTYTVCLTMGYSYKAALAAVFVSGIIFVVISVTGIRKQIINSIPAQLKLAIGAGIGFFIAFVGLKNAGIIVANSSTAVGLGDLGDPTVLLALFGIIVTIVLLVKKVPAAVFVGMVITAVVGIVCNLIFHVDGLPALPEKLFELNFNIKTIGAFSAGFGELFADPLQAIVVIFSFLFVDFFDTAGTLVAVANRIGLVNEKGELLLSPYIPIIIGDLKKHSISEYLKKNYGELWNHQLIRTFRKNIGSANEIILGKDFPAEVGMNYMKFDVFSEENMEQMNKCYAELIKSYGGQNVL